MVNKSRLLREKMSGPRIVRAVGARDGLSAKLVEEAGFEAVWSSSFEMSASHGVPDSSLLSMTQYLDIAESMELVSNLPVIVDSDTGFGGPLNLAYAVRRFEHRGIAAVCVEDKLFPKANSFMDADHLLVPVKDFVEKIRAGKEAQSNEDFVIIARTEALIANKGIEEALERAHAYADAGADAVLVHSKSKEPDQVLDFASQWTRDTPLVAVPTSYPQVKETTLHDAGFRIVIYANQGLRAAVKGMRSILGELSELNSAGGIEDKIVPMCEIFAMQRLPFLADER